MTTIVDLDITNIPGIVIYNTIVVSISRCMYTTNQLYICDPPRQNEALLAGAQNALQTKTLFYSHFSENVFRIYNDPSNTKLYVSTNADVISTTQICLFCGFVSPSKLRNNRRLIVLA